VVKNIRRIIKDKKVGHGGTLDPFAEGVLIIGTGKDTKKLSNIINDEKVYVAGLELGIKTDTLDPEGKIIVEKTVPVLTKDEIKTVLGSFLGKSLQIPPMFSAKRINGQRLYKLARRNIKIKREPIKINISDIALIDYKENIITFSVRCSKGTYIRVLGKDIAEKLNTVGYLKSLKRTNVGQFSIKDSIKIDSFETEWKSLET
jgi:tRNA pseudouridine55 synthase